MMPLKEVKWQNYCLLIIWSRVWVQLQLLVPGVRKWQRKMFYDRFPCRKSILRTLFSSSYGEGFESNCRCWSPEIENGKGKCFVTDALTGSKFLELFSPHIKVKGLEFSCCCLSPENKNSKQKCFIEDTLEGSEVV